MKRFYYLILAVLVPMLPNCPEIAARGDQAVAAILPRNRLQVLVPVTAGCLGGVCPTAVAPAVDPSAAPSPAAKAIPPAAAALVIPGLVLKAPAPPTPKPFPGPSVGPPRVLWVWDNGLIWEQGANVWRWQNDDGTWNQK